MHCPVSGVGRLNGSLLFCFRKDVALVSHCVPGLGRGTEERKKTKKRKNERMNGLGDGTFHVHRLYKSCKSGTVPDLIRITTAGTSTSNSICSSVIKSKKYASFCGLFGLAIKQYHLRCILLFCVRSKIICGKVEENKQLIRSIEQKGRLSCFTLLKWSGIWKPYWVNGTHYCRRWKSRP